MASYLRHINYAMLEKAFAKAKVKWKEKGIAYRVANWRLRGGSIEQLTFCGRCITHRSHSGVRAANLEHDRRFDGRAKHDRFGATYGKDQDHGNRR